jgi:hypothetical protein
MKIKYLKVKEVTRSCMVCSGMGFFWDKEYHNQLKKRKCYICDGTGKEKGSITSDATTEVQQLRRRLKKYKQALIN